MHAVPRQLTTPLALPTGPLTRGERRLPRRVEGAGTRLAGELLGASDPIAELRAAAGGSTSAGTLASLVLVAVRDLDTHALAHDTALREPFRAGEEGRELVVLAERRSAAVAWLARLVTAYRSTTGTPPRAPALVPVPRPAVA